MRFFDRFGRRVIDGLPDIDELYAVVLFRTASPADWFVAYVLWLNVFLVLVLSYARLYSLL